MLKIKIPGIESIFPGEKTEFALKHGDIEVAYSLSGSAGEMSLKAVLRNTGSSSVKIGALKLLTIEEVNEPIYYNNWQSWFPFKAYWEQPVVKPFVQFADSTGSSLFSATPIPGLLRNDVRPSDYFIATDELVAGFLSCSLTHPYFTWNDKEYYIDIWIELFNKAVGAGEEIEIEELLILHGRYLWEMLEAYAERIKEYNGVSFREFNGVGWCSWYHYFTEIDFKELEKNVALLKEIREREAIPYSLVQLDDGYQKDIGDWLETNEKFPSLDEIASMIKEGGFTAGLWLAPFSVSETSEIFSDHNDWLVRGLDGKPKLAYRNWQKNIYALDVTNPEAAEHLYKTMRRLREAGFDYIKIDFLFAGAIPGERFDRSYTPVQAYRIGLKIIREALGSDCFILGCGAPLLPSVGFVDGMRIGADTAPSWRADVMDIGIPSAKLSIRNAFTRSFMHRRLWLNDPDTIILRDCELTADEKRTFALSAGLLDGMILTSDDMSLVSREGISLLKEALELTGGKPRVFLDGMNGVFAACTKAARKYNVTAFVNLTDTPRHGIKLKSYYRDWSGVTPSMAEADLFPRKIWLEKVETRARELEKIVEIREDGRQFNYYTEKE